MSAAILLAREQWRFWWRSRLALAASMLFLALLVSTAVLTALRIAEQAHERRHQQQTANSTFLAQPDRHPHRMVHYGHYVFRTPSPLAAFDPGLDPVTGQSLFLEGHRQNAAAFADSGASADLGGLAWLTPAFVYQLFAPLLIILLGHNAVARERESSTLAAILAQGISGVTVLGGKAIALLFAIALLLVPLLLVAVLAVGQGESLAAALLMLAAYLLYLAVWGLLTLLLSLLAKQEQTALARLTALWLACALLLPSLAVNNTARTLPIAGQIETDLDMLEDLRKLGDGHNAADPAFARLRRDLLKEYGVDTVEELPVNLRGVVAEYSEARITETLNAYADRRMAREQEQANLLARHGWLTPVLAIAQASRAIAATDLGNHQRFLRAAEALRFDFVQGLNRLHAQKLAYSDDMQRSRDKAAERRTRIAAENWRVLADFHFVPDSPGNRAKAALPSLLALLVWFLALAAASFGAASALSR